MKMRGAISWVEKTTRKYWRNGSKKKKKLTTEEDEIYGSTISPIVDYVALVLTVRISAKRAVLSVWAGVLDGTGTAKVLDPGPLDVSTQFPVENSSLKKVKNLYLEFKYSDEVESIILKRLGFSFDLVRLDWEPVRSWSRQQSFVLNSRDKVC